VSVKLDERLKLSSTCKLLMKVSAGVGSLDTQSQAWDKSWFMLEY